MADSTVKYKRPSWLFPLLEYTKAILVFSFRCISAIVSYIGWPEIGCIVEWEKFTSIFSGVDVHINNLITEVVRTDKVPTIYLLNIYLNI